MLIYNHLYFNKIANHNLLYPRIFGGAKQDCFTQIFSLQQVTKYNPARVFEKMTQQISSTLSKQILIINQLQFQVDKTPPGISTFSINQY